MSRGRRNSDAFRRLSARRVWGHGRVWTEPSRGMTVKKIAFVLGASLVMVTAANAADLPRRQPVPVYPQAPIGKMPIGKSPIGKAPIGKAPGPYVSRY